MDRVARVSVALKVAVGTKVAVWVGVAERLLSKRCGQT